MTQNWLTDLLRIYHPLTGQANVFGVILYTYRHVNVRKVLNDDIYWKGLNEVSGPRWAVFACRAATGAFEVPLGPPGMLGFLVPVWKEPSENLQLLEAFELESTKDLPSLVVFVEKDNTVRRTVLSIDETSEDSVYKSLSKCLNIVAISLERMREKYLRRGTRAYQVVESELSHYKGWQAALKGMTILGLLRSFISG